MYLRIVGCFIYTINSKKPYLLPKRAPFVFIVSQKMTNFAS